MTFLAYIIFISGTSLSLLFIVLSYKIIRYNSYNFNLVKGHLSSSKNNNSGSLSFGKCNAPDDFFQEGLVYNNKKKQYEPSSKISDENINELFGL